MKVQTNDALLSVMLHTWAHNVTSEKTVFEDKRMQRRTSAPSYRNANSNWYTPLR
jgi:hypothetical protein